MYISYFKTNLVQLILIYKRALTFSNNFLIFASPPPTCAPKMNKIKKKNIGDSDNNLHRYSQGNFELKLLLALCYYFALIIEQSQSISFIP